MTHLSKYETLAALVQQRDLINDGAGQVNPFGCSAWLDHFAAQVIDDQAMRGVLIKSAASDGSAALMALSCDPARPWLLRGLCNYYSSLHSPFYTRAADRATAAKALVAALLRESPACAVLQLSPLDADSDDAHFLRQALSDHGWYTKTYFLFGNWYLPCDGLAFSDYMKARDSQLFNTWQRKTKKFGTGAGSQARVEVVTDPADVDRAMDAYEAVYAKSWKKPEPFPDFARGWARTCAANGWLRLGLAWVDGAPIAAQFWFTRQRRAYIFKLAYDEAYSKWSAGTVLTAHLMRQALDEDRVEEIDYLTGDDPYKKGWMSHRRERSGLLACNLRTVRGLSTAARESLAGLARRVIGPAAAAATSKSHSGHA